jgi:hypothetical protein
MASPAGSLEVVVEAASVVCVDCSKEVVVRESRMVDSVVGPPSDWAVVWPEVVVSTGVVGSIVDSVEIEKMSEGRLLGLQGPAATEAARTAATKALATMLVRIFGSE